VYANSHLRYNRYNSNLPFFEDFPFEKAKTSLTDLGLVFSLQLGSVCTHLHTRAVASSDTRQSGAKREGIKQVVKMFTVFDPDPPANRSGPLVHI
jgi:hypothetical protein